MLSDDHYFFLSTREIREICKPLRSIEITHFSYTKSYLSGTRVYLTTHPDLLKNYFSNEFYRIGHCECVPNSYQEQTIVWSSLPQQIIFEKAKQYGIVDGIFIIKPNLKFTEFFNFGHCKDEKNILNIYLTHFEIIKKFINYFKEKTASIIKKAEQINFILPHQQNQLRLMNLTDETIELKQKLNYDAAALSKRQFECATRIIKGKSTKTIAYELNLSPRTIESYIENLKHKFSLHTKTELILKLAKILDE